MRLKQLGAWVAGVAATVVTGVATYWLTEGLRQQPATDPGPTAETEAPRAPELDVDPRTQVMEEDFLLLTLDSGASHTVKVMDVWHGAIGAEPSCVDAGLLVSWMVRDPYPDSVKNLEIRRPLPRAGGRTEVAGEGPTGQAGFSWCGEFTVTNRGLEPRTVELRLGSVMW